MVLMMLVRTENRYRIANAAVGIRIILAGRMDNHRIASKEKPLQAPFLFRLFHVVSAAIVKLVVQAKH